MEYELKTIAESNANRYTLCDGNDNFYTINWALYEILGAYKENKSYKAVCEKINAQRTENFLTEDFVEASIKKAIAIIDKPAPTSAENSNYIRLTLILVKSGGGSHFF